MIEVFYSHQLVFSIYSEFSPVLIDIIHIEVCNIKMLKIILLEQISISEILVDHLVLLKQHLSLSVN